MNTTAGRNDVGQVGKLLDHDDGVVQRWLEESGDGVGDQDGNHHRDDVTDGSRHL